MSDPFRSISSLADRVPAALRHPLLASALGLGAACLSWGIISIGGHLVTNADSALYDLWAAQRAPASEASILLIDRQGTSREGLAPLPWDRAALARVIAALAQADAAAIGLDEYVTAPSSPDHGGAAADALLAEAISQHERVVLPIPLLAHDPSWQIGRADSTIDRPRRHGSWPLLPSSEGSRLLAATLLAAPITSLAETAAGIAHQVALPDADGEFRRLPLYVRLQDHVIPAFGLSLFLTARQAGPASVRIRPGSYVEIPSGTSTAEGGDLVAIPIDVRGQTLFPGLAKSLPALRRVSLDHLVLAVQRGDIDQLRRWADHHIVILPGTLATSEESAPSQRLAHQVILLQGLMTRNWISPLSTQLGLLLAWFLAGVGTWLLLRWRDWHGLAGLVALVLLYGMAVWAGLSVARTSLPVLGPVAAVALAGLGSVLWNHLSAARLLRSLESNVVRVQAELAAVREALVCQESTVEQLEEDLEAARAQTARATDREQALTCTAADIQRELDQAKNREKDTRDQLAQLERELAGLRAVSLTHAPIPETELDALRAEAERLGILTRDTRLLRTFRDLKRAAQSVLPVLILGESGTGKELFARAVHRLSPRHERALIVVNMAAISPELFESELFGHVRGSFTGATQDRPGYFELAAQGTIFLDEIGDLRPEHQAKLLRVLQDRSFYRVGATKPTVVDVRVVAATNKDLLRGVAEGWFREDLYARLKGVVVELPPLRDRPDDLLYLADRLLSQAAERAHRAGMAFSQDALAALRGYPWPQNIRELAQCLELAVALADGSLLHPKDLRLPDVLRTGVTQQSRRAPTPADVSGDAAVLEHLRRHSFDMQATARALGWDRSTVTQRLKGLCFQALVDTHDDKAKAAALLAQDPALLRTVELKLLEYMEHLTTVISGYATESEAIMGCRRRFKNLPDRHFKAVEHLIRRHFEPSQRP